MSHSNPPGVGKSAVFQVFIDSSSRTADSSSTTNFKIDLPEAVYIYRFRFVNISCFMTGYTINSSNNTIRFTANATTTTASIASGVYTGASLASALQTAMATAVVGTTVTYSDITYKLTFLHASSIQILLTGSTIATQIGLAADTASSTSVSPSIPVNLHGTRVLILQSKTLSSKQLPSIYNGHQKPFLELIPVTVGLGESLCHQFDLAGGWHYFANRGKVQTLDFSLLMDDAATVYDNNGMPVSLYLEIDKFIE